MSDVEKKPRSPDWLPTWELIALALGDLIVFVAFAAIGRARHNLTAPEGDILATINTAMPFTVAWLVVGAATGAFHGKALYPLTRVLWRTFRAAVIAGPLGVVLRAALLAGPELRRFPIIPTSFLLVATGVTTLLLILWRVLWSRVRRLWWPELP